MKVPAILQRLHPRWIFIQNGAALFFLFIGIIFLNSIFLPRLYSPTVIVENVTPTPLALTIRAFGFIDAKSSLTLRAEFEGPILTKRFKEGDVVKKGQVLATFGRDKIKLDYQAKQDAFANAQSDFVHAKKELRLQRALFQKEAVASSSVDDARRALVHAEQAVESAREAFHLTQETWRHNILTAPFSGTITKDSLLDDRSVVTGKDILTVSDVSEFTAVARVNELDSKQLRIGQQADVRLPIFENHSLSAVVSQIGSAQQTNGSTEVVVTLKLISLSGLNLSPKLTAEVRIATGMTDAALSVPLTSLSNADGTPRVWVVDRWHRLRSRVVTLGRSNTDRAEVVQGLADHDRVCLHPQPNFAEGMKVRVRHDRAS